MHRLASLWPTINLGEKPTQSLDGYKVITRDWGDFGFLPIFFCQRFKAQKWLRTTVIPCDLKKATFHRLKVGFRRSTWEVTEGWKFSHKFTEWSETPVPSADALWTNIKTGSLKSISAIGDNKPPWKKLQLWHLVSEVICGTTLSENLEEESFIPSLGTTKISC